MYIITLGYALSDYVTFRPQSSHFKKLCDICYQTTVVTIKQVCTHVHLIHNTPTLSLYIVLPVANTHNKLHNSGYAKVFTSIM